MKFTKEQTERMETVKKKEQKEEEATQKRIAQGVSQEARVLAKKLAGVSALKDKPKLRGTIGTFLAPYVQGERSRVAGAFVRNH